MIYVWLFFGQMLNFLIVVLNVRASTRGYIKFTMLSDLVFCFVSALMIRKIAVATSFYQLLAYSAGGSCGSGIAIVLSRHWDHK
jgi:hypothetical protein